MANKRRERHTTLRLERFTPREAKMLSEIPANTPALKLCREARIVRWNKFEKLAATKIANGKWRRGEIKQKWINNLSRLYTRMGWRVKGEYQKGQQIMPRGSPNPFAMYRYFEKLTGGHDAQGQEYIAQWQARQVKHGKNRLEKGLIFVQREEKKAKAAPSKKASDAQIRSWIEQKNTAIASATGKRKQQLVIERNRLERML